MERFFRRIAPYPTYRRRKKKIKDAMMISIK